MALCIAVWKWKQSCWQQGIHSESCDPGLRRALSPGERVQQEDFTNPHVNARAPMTPAPETQSQEDPDPGQPGPVREG